MSCGVVCRLGSDPELLWLWLRHRLVATALIQSLACEPPYAIKKKKKKNFCLGWKIQCVGAQKPQSPEGPKRGWVRTAAAHQACGFQSLVQLLLCSFPQVTPFRVGLLWDYSILHLFNHLASVLPQPLPQCTRERTKV